MAQDSEASRCATQRAGVSLLDDAGNASGSLALGASLSACVVQAAPWTAGPGKPERSLTDQIAAVIQASDADLAPAQRILLADLARLADPKATEVLIRLASDARTVPVILRDARALLATRKSGAEYMLKSSGASLRFSGRRAADSSARPRLRTRCSR